MEQITLYTNWPPTVNSYYSHTRNGVFISKKGRQYTHSVELDVKEQCGELLLTERLLVEVYLFPPDRRVRDLDNYMKALQDSITKAGLWEDDSLIDQLFIYRGAVTKGGLVRLEISEAGPVMPCEKF